MTLYKEYQTTQKVLDKSWVVGETEQYALLARKSMKIKKNELNKVNIAKNSWPLCRE
jgi:hypothetical protein